VKRLLKQLCGACTSFLRSPWSLLTSEIFLFPHEPDGFHSPTILLGHVHTSMGHYLSELLV
jgi:hypothetical protein